MEVVSIYPLNFYFADFPASFSGEIVLEEVNFTFYILNWDNKKLKDILKQDI